jgi:hypothetical protein
MISKIFSPKNSAKTVAFFTQSAAIKANKNDHHQIEHWFLRKTLGFFRRKSAIIAKIFFFMYVHNSFTEQIGAFFCSKTSLARIRRSKIGEISLEQGCQIFLGTTYQNGKIYRITIKYTKWPQTISNGRKNRQNGHKKYQHLPLQVPPKFTQTRIFGLKICHLATLVLRSFPIRTHFFIKSLSLSGLPDDFFLDQKYQNGYILEGLGMENVVINSGHLEYFTTMG